MAATVGELCVHVYILFMHSWILVSIVTVRQDGQMSFALMIVVQVSIIIVGS